MEKHKSYLTLLATMLIFFNMGVSYAFSETYYVDFAGGDDSNTGTSTSAPWVHCPGDPKAAGNPADVALSPGDKVYFKGGIQYRGQINVNWSGSSGNLIAYDGNSAGTWGTGQAIIDAQSKRAHCFNFASANNYISINNFDLRNGSPSSSTRLINAQNLSSHVDVSHCTIHSTGNSSPFLVTGMGIYVGGSYWTVHDNLLYDCYDTAIYLINGASYNQVYNNEFHDKIRWGIVVKGDTGVTTETDNSIYNNYFHDIYHYDNLGPHVDFIFLSQVSSGQINNTRIYNNIFANYKKFTNYGGTAFIYASISNARGGSINNTYIYNNVFHNPHMYYATRYEPVTGNINNVYFYNNSYYTSRPIPLFYSDTCGSGYSMSGIYFEDNIVKNTGLALWLNGRDTNNVNIDYNDYCTTDSRPFRINNNYYSMSNWSALGYDANSEGPQSDPLYVNATDMTSNLALGVGSPAIGAGTNLSSVFITDKDNSPRPRSGMWCMGAYEVPR
ncbi:MAG: choice-of-anchor Q domain-containing protein [Nitrospirota bacterium]